MVRRSFVFPVGLAAAIAISASGGGSLSAQSGAGAVQGTISDSSGATLPGVVVHVVNRGTGQTYDTKSNDAGLFTIPSLFAGDYVVTFTLPGMKTSEQSLKVLVGQTITLNPSLEVGEVTEQVVVSGNDVQLATYDSPTISSTLENERINQLPMNGRNILTLTGQTTPGLEAGGTRANGNLAAAIEYVQDGAPLNNYNYGGPTRMPDPDSISEVRVETSNSSALFSTPATGVITTKSGTNSLHGSFFETMRNNYIGVAKARQDPANLKAPHLVRNEFGASLGGPVIIPKIYNGKERTFFFAAYERFSLRSNSSVRLAVPTAANRQGDFSNAQSGGNPVVLYDNTTTNPTTYQRTAFAGNQIPISRMSPLAKTLYAMTPLPNTQDNPFVAGNLIYPSINNQTAPTFTTRLDHNFNDSNRAYLRYSWVNVQSVGIRNNPTLAPASLAYNDFPAGAVNLVETPTIVHSAVIGVTHIFSPTFLSETVVSNQWEGDKVNGGPNAGLNYEQMLGLPNNFGLTGFPNIGTNLLSNYDGTQFAYGGSQIITNIDENLTRTLNRHQLQFGIRFRNQRLGVSPDQRLDQVTYTNYATAVYDPASGANYTPKVFTGNANADFFLGAASKYVVNLQEKYLHYSQREFDSYIQDNFHVNPRLVINAGLRWEIHPAAAEQNRQNNGFDFANKAIVLGQPVDKMIARGATTQAAITNLQNLGVKFETPAEAGLPDTMVFDSNFVFSPRVGIAYTPFASNIGTVIRAGYGRYVYATPLRNFYASQSTNAPYQFAYSTDYNSANQSPDGKANYLLRSSSLPAVAGQNSTNVVDTTSTNAILPGINETVLSPHYPPNLVTQANLTIEQPIKWQTVLRLTYIHNHGSNLDQLYNPNFHPSAYTYEKTAGQIVPTAYGSIATGPYDQTTYNQIAVQTRNGVSNNDSLQMNLQHLYKQGYAFQVFYVFSRAFRMGGNTFRDSQIYPVGDYAPGMSPVSTTGLRPWEYSKELNYIQNYMIDSAIPKHRISFNGVVDLPFGRKKLFFGKSNRFVDELIGGFQLAGSGSVFSQYIALNMTSTPNWGPTSPIQIYKHAKPVTDCRSGVCRKAYMWFNGYLSPNQIGTANGVQGLPSDYVPFQTPINNTPGAQNNNVPVTLKNGSTVTVAYDPGPKLYAFNKTFLPGPFNYNVDMSLFKIFPITESMKLRINVDAFNVFNIQGFVNPGLIDGIQQLTSSYNTPRQLQFTARFSF